MRPSTALCNANSVGLIWLRWYCLITWRSDRLIQYDFLSFQVPELRSANRRPFKGIVLKQAFFDAAVWELHAASTVLNTVAPLTLVAAAVLPVHFTVAVALIIFVATLVVVARFPSEETKSILFIVLVAALILIAGLRIESLLPLAAAMLQSVFELANVDAAVLPLVLALSFRLSIHVDAGEDVTVCEEIGALPVLQTVEPLSFEAVPVFPLMNSIARRF